MNAVPIAQIAVPVLVVHNRDDRCPSSPYPGAEQAMAQLTAAPAKELLAVAGGASFSRDCGALSPHGYYRIEDQVVAAHYRWIEAHPPRTVSRHALALLARRGGSFRRDPRRHQCTSRAASLRRLSVLGRQDARRSRRRG